jgi:hypothetical protein
MKHTYIHTLQLYLNIDTLTPEYPTAEEYICEGMPMRAEARNLTGGHAEHMNHKCYEYHT